MEEYKHEEFDNCFLCKHPALRHVLTGLLIFLGAFCAFYVVSDWHFKRMLDPYAQMKRFDRDMMRQEKRFDKMAKREFQRQHRLEQQASQYVHVEKTPDAYRFVIDLRPFDNNEKNVEIKTEGNNLLINAAGEKNSRRGEEIVKYNQTFVFGEKIDSENITKVREGNNYIITVPVD